MERLLFEDVRRQPRRRRDAIPYATTQVVTSILLSALVSGCAESYCQYGSKYGWQCYNVDATSWQETQVRGETISERYVRGPSHPSGEEPVGPEAAAPGCIVPMTPYGLYVMSGACTTQRLPVPGAVR